MNLTDEKTRWCHPHIMVPWPSHCLIRHRPGHVRRVTLYCLHFINHSCCCRIMPDSDLTDCPRTVRWALSDRCGPGNGPVRRLSADRSVRSEPSISDPNLRGSRCVRAARRSCELATGVDVFALSQKDMSNLLHPQLPRCSHRQKFI